MKQLPGGLSRCIVLLRRSTLLFLVIHRRKPFGRTSAVYGDGSSTAPCRAELLALPDSSVQATPVQDLVRREDSEYLVGFKEKILLSSVEFNETVGSEVHARVHIDLALTRAGVYRRLTWR